MRFRRVGGDFRTENRSQNRLKTADRMWNSLPEPGAGGGFGTTWHASLKIVFHTGKLFGVSLWKNPVRRGKPEVLHLFRRVFHTRGREFFHRENRGMRSVFPVSRFSPHRFSTPFHNFSTTCGKLCGNCGKRAWRTGKRGGAWRWVVPLGNGDPACRRPAWGGVRCAAMVGGCA